MADVWHVARGKVTLAGNKLWVSTWGTLGDPWRPQVIFGDKYGGY